MSKNTEYLSWLTKMRNHNLQEIEGIKQEIAELQKHLTRLVLKVDKYDTQIDEFNREALVSPSIDKLPIPSHQRKLLKKAQITNVFFLRVALRSNHYIRGIGDKSKERLRVILATYDEQAQVAVGETE